MTDAKALNALSFNYTEGADDVWRPSPFHVEGLHGGSTKILLDGLAEAHAQRTAAPSAWSCRVSAAPARRTCWAGCAS